MRSRICRENQAGRGDQREDREQHREHGGDRQHAAVPAGGEEREREVHGDVGDLDGVAPSSTFQPLIVTIRTSAALTSSSSTTIARVAWTAGLSRLGWVMTRTPAGRSAGGHRGYMPGLVLEDAATLGSEARAWWNW